MRQVFRSILPLLSITFLLSSCGVGADMSAGPALADKFYLAVATGDVERVLDAYSPEFFEATAEDEWRPWLASFLEGAGPYRSHEVLNTSVSKTIRTGTTIVVLVRVTYENYTTKEKLTFRGSDEGMLIGHHLYPDQPASGGDDV